MQSVLEKNPAPKVEDITEEERTIPASKKRPTTIFNEEEMSSLLVAYEKDPTIEQFQIIVEKCIPLMDYIISTFDLRNLYCDANDLRNELTVKMPHYFVVFAKKRGRLFSYLSTCFKNYLNSYTTKLATRRFYDSSDDVLQHEDIERTNRDYALDLSKYVKEMQIRNIDYTTIRVYRYYADAVREGFIDCKNGCIHTASIMHGISEDTCEFLYGTFMYELRSCMLADHIEKISLMDLHTVSSIHSFLPELLDCIGEENTKKVIMLFGGSSLKIPRIENIKKMETELKIFKHLEKDYSPESIAKISRTTGVQKAKVKKIYDAMAKTISKVSNKKAKVLISGEKVMKKYVLVDQAGKKLSSPMEEAEAMKEKQKILNESSTSVVRLVQVLNG